MARKSVKTIAEEMAVAIETVRRRNGEVDRRQIHALGFTNQEIDAFGDDARALHAKAHPDLEWAA